jgi:hypothetical protein
MAAETKFDHVERDSINAPALKETPASLHDATVAASNYINAMGVGRFTVLLVLIYGFNNTTQALELSIATYLSVCATGDLGLSTTYEQYGSGLLTLRGVGGSRTTGGSAPLGPTIP